MIGKRQQPGLFEADQMYLDYVGRDTIYGFLARQRWELFREEDFAELYCPDNGRPSVSPSLLANAILQTYERVSDEKAKARADYDQDFARCAVRGSFSPHGGYGGGGFRVVLAH